MNAKSGGAIVAEVLQGNRVEFLYTLCGGHISPILVESKRLGIEVVDTRHEASAVFAADATARLTGGIGVAAVTAGPGVTNTVTAVKNAQMAETPLLIIGGATATVLRGRGSLQDIEQLALFRSIVKWSHRVRTVNGIKPTLERAIRIAKEGVPGPVFVEFPIDLLYPESVVADWYQKETGEGTSLSSRALRLYMKGHLYKQFHTPEVPVELGLPSLRARRPTDTQEQVRAAADLLRQAERPVVVVGNQTLVAGFPPAVAARSLEEIGVPTFLAGMSRGVLGAASPLQYRHKRSKALRRADVAVVVGFPFDFRLGYGRSINSKAKVISANLDSKALRKNRRPDIAVEMHPGAFLQKLAQELGGRRSESLPAWRKEIGANESERETEIAAMAEIDTDGINPLSLLKKVDESMAEDSVIIVDGGDFAASAAYTLRPRAPLSWLDPGVFGTLGVGGGFALAACLTRSDAEVWLIYGYGSSAYSLAEFETCARMKLGPIALIGNDASWAQIARDQVELLGDDTGTVLTPAAYHTVAEGYGGVGIEIRSNAEIAGAIRQAKSESKKGRPVCINAHIGKTDFRKGSISV